MTVGGLLGKRSAGPRLHQSGGALETTSRVRSRTGRYVAIGAHGGAGTTAVVRLLNPSRGDSIVEWRPGMPAETGCFPLLVARSTASGLAAAAGWVVRWRPDLPAPVLLVVADAPYRLPPVVRYRCEALSSQVKGIVEVPYLYMLRHLDDPAEALRQRKVAAAMDKVRHRIIAVCEPERSGR